MACLLHWVYRTFWLSKVVVDLSFGLSVKNWRRQSHVNVTELLTWHPFLNTDSKKNRIFVIFHVRFVLWFLRRSDVMHSDKSDCCGFFIDVYSRTTDVWHSLMCTHWKKSNSFLVGCARTGDGHLSRMNTSSSQFLIFDKTNKTCSPRIMKLFSLSLKLDVSYRKRKKNATLCNICIGVYLHW